MILNSIQKELLERDFNLSLDSCKLTEIPVQFQGLNYILELNLRHNKISHIKGLEMFSKLKILDLSYNQISEITGLDALVDVEELNLSHNQIRNIAGLEKLKNLRKLYLNNNQIKHIAGLDELTNLQELDISNNKIVELKGLENSTKLQLLDLHNNSIEDVSTLKQIVWMPFLEELYLFGIKENNLEIPEEKFGEKYKIGNKYEMEKFGYGDYGNILYPKNYIQRPSNCIKLLQSYFIASKDGASYSREVAIVFIGNATVGKTSLRYFLKERKFPLPELENCSTHGIEPDIWKLPQELTNDVSSLNSLEGVEIYFWDFGGQEYYHATHRLFIAKEAIYILVWDLSTNKQIQQKTKIRIRRSNGLIDEIDQTLELFSYEYWIRTIRFFAPDAKLAPIMLVQNKIDEIGNNKLYPEPVLFEKYGKLDIHHLSLQNSISARPNELPYLDFQIFLKRLLYFINDRLTNTARETYWEGVRFLISKLKVYKKIWSPNDLLIQVQKSYPDVSSDGFPSYLNSLSSKGLIFYYEEDFYLKDFVFLSPSWVTEVIYEILDLSVLENNGEFDRKHIESKIQQFGDGNAEVFIALLKKFNLIFENPESGQFIAPQYLPENLSEKKMSMGTWNRLKYIFKDFLHPTFYLRSADFLPPSIMLRFLSFYGPRVIDQIYWKNGIAFMIEGIEVVILAEYKSFTFKIFVDNDNKYVQGLVFNTLFQLLESSEKMEIGVKNNCYVLFSELKKYISNDKVANVNGDLVDCDAFRHFLTLKENYMKDENVLFNSKKIIKIFVSYAHEDQLIKDALVNTHLKAIGNHYDDNIIVWTDAEIKPGCNWDDTIINELELSDIVLFLITSNFLASDYILNTEIKKAIGRFKQKKQIIVPIYLQEVSKKLLPFKEKQYLPNGTALENWKSKSKGWTKIQDGIIDIIDDIRNGKTNQYYGDVSG